MSSRVRAAVDRLDRSVWLFVLLLLLMLLPAAFVLWFMNEAIVTRTAEAERSVQEAYRGQLRLVQARIDGYWQARAASLRGDGSPGAFFGQHLRKHTADGLVVLASDGRPLYPSPAGQSDPRITSELEQRIRALDRFVGVENPPPDMQVEIERLRDTLNNDDAPLAARTRLALMDDLRRVAPNVSLPTQAPLRVSLAWTDTGAVIPDSGGLHETAIPRLWALASSDRRVVELHWTGQIESTMHDFLHEVEPEGIRFIAFPPGVQADDEAIAAGMWMPGWQLSFVPLARTSFDDRARQQVLRYIWVAVAGIALTVGLGATAGRALFRQMQLARLKTDLVSAVSHELRTPVASIRVLVEGLQDDRTIDARKTREYLDMIATENARLGRLIENFLTFSRLERSRYRFEFSAAYPRDVVALAVDAVRDRVPVACDLRVEVDAALPPLRADADALGIALANLLDNALKYTPEEKRIRIRASRDGNGYVSFEVEDNGIGIAPREQRRIFRRFHRVDQRLSRDTGGVGLGLSIVELIVRAHRGSISVRSDIGAGSTFTVRLPSEEGVAA